MKKLLLMLCYLTAISVSAQIKDLVKEGYYVETGNTTLRATNSIIIKPHTHIKPGSTFRAFITPDVFPEWKVGSGSANGFPQNGATKENSREIGKNHVGEKVVLWKATPDATANADGGWNSTYHTIDHTKTYRFSVWIKKTNSNSGATYFGCMSRNNILKLDGNLNNNPYFWYGDLPRLNRWYLLVGFVHGSGYTSKISKGAIYDGTTGERVKSITDFKFKSTATSVAHRAYLYYDTNTLDRQYFYKPRIDLVNGKEFSIKELLQINDHSKLVVSYDVAGNQTKAFYCGDPAFCTPVPASARKAARPTLKNNSVVYANDNHNDDEHVHQEEFEETADTNSAENNEEPSKKADIIFLYPNPTRGLVTIKIKKSQLANIHSIRLYNANSVFMKDLNFGNQNTMQIDLTDAATGVYFVHVHLHKGQSITKRIIKN